MKSKPSLGTANKCGRERAGLAWRQLYDAVTVRALRAYQELNDFRAINTPRYHDPEIPV